MPPAPAREKAAEPCTAIIDIGSNSIRLVVYQGPARLPAVLFNEKVLAGLGRGLAATGAIEDASLDMARTALARFARLAREMAVTRVRTVATAAVRDASNGHELIAAAAAVGLTVEILSGAQEAQAAGYGVLSGIPDADGIVGDLGGGSLELVRVSRGAVGDRISFPFGVLRLAAMRDKGQPGIDAVVSQAIANAGWAGRGKGLPLYLVGGSWRGLGRLDMHRAHYPLPIVQNYAMTPATITALAAALRQTSKAELRDVPGLSTGRIPTLGDAATLLDVLIARLGCRQTIVSAFGLREGLLYGDLDADARAQDPLIVAVRDEGRRSGRFPEHGDLLDRWIAPLFEGDSPAEARLRLAACQLADVGWRANPDFRAERGVEIALHGNWVAIDAAGRAQVAQALHTSLGGGATAPDPIPQLASADAIRRATAWGLAIRLGQRLSAGLAGPLQRSRVSREGEVLTLWLEPADRVLYGEAVQKRHAALAAQLGATAMVKD